VAQLVKAMCYKTGGRGFDSRCDRVIIDVILPVDLPLTKMSTRNISWGKGGRWVGLTLPPSCVDCLKIWSLNLLEISGPVQACNWIALPVGVHVRVIG
jgi:hypothetical protein